MLKMTFPRLLSWITALSAAVAVLLSAITCTKHHLKVIRRDQFGKMENFYRTIRDRNNKSYNEPHEDITPTSKNTICTNIFTSGLFHMLEYEPMNMDTEADLAKYNFHLHSNSQPHDYKNPTTRINVIVARQTDLEHDSFPEFVFLCPVWNNIMKQVQEVYVSEEYNLNDDTSGRFLFKEVRGTGIVLMTVAEEPAWLHKSWPEDLELAYLRQRANKKPASNEKEDPICGLDTDSKIEICSSILNSEYFAGELVFYPTPLTIGEPCMKRKVGFHIEGTKVPTDNEEWMLLCDAFAVRPANDEVRHQVYYVSRSYSDTGKAHLYTLNTKNNRMYLKSVFVSNVINI